MRAINLACCTLALLLSSGAVNANPKPACGASVAANGNQVEITVWAIGAFVDSLEGQGPITVYRDSSVGAPDPASPTAIKVAELTAASFKDVGDGNMEAKIVEPSAPCGSWTYFDDPQLCLQESVVLCPIYDAGVDTSETVDAAETGATDPPDEGTNEVAGADEPQASGCSASGWTEPSTGWQLSLGAGALALLVRRRRRSRVIPR